MQTQCQWLCDFSDCVLTIFMSSDRKRCMYYYYVLHTLLLIKCMHANTCMVVNNLYITESHSGRESLVEYSIVPRTHPSTPPSRTTGKYVTIGHAKGHEQPRSQLAVQRTVCFLLRKTGHDHREKPKQPYPERSLLVKSVLLNPKKHHKKGYDTLYVLGNE